MAADRPPSAPSGKAAGTGRAASAGAAGGEAGNLPVNLLGPAFRALQFAIVVLHTAQQLEDFAADAATEFV